MIFVARWRYFNGLAIQAIRTAARRKSNYFFKNSFWLQTGFFFVLTSPSLANLFSDPIKNPYSRLASSYREFSLKKVRLIWKFFKNNKTGACREHSPRVRCPKQQTLLSNGPRLAVRRSCRKCDGSRYFGETCYRHRFYGTCIE